MIRRIQLDSIINHPHQGASALKYCGLTPSSILNFLHGRPIGITADDGNVFHFTLKRDAPDVFTVSGSGFAEISIEANNTHFYSINANVNNPNYDPDGYNCSYPAIDVREKGYDGIFGVLTLLALLACKSISKGNGKYTIGDTSPPLTKREKIFLESIGFKKEANNWYSFDLGGIDLFGEIPGLPHLPTIIRKAGRETPGGNRRVGKNIYVSDNHHYALLSWAEAFARRQITKGSLVVHLDAHPDMESAGDISALKYALSNRSSKRETTRAVKQFLFSLPPVGVHQSGFDEDSFDPLAESVFIVPAIQIGLVKNCIWIPSYWDVHGKQIEEGRNTLSIDNFANSSTWASSPSRILDIDLDFFNCIDRGYHNPNPAIPTLDEIKQKVIDILRPDIVTIALSRSYTGFTDNQERELIRRIIALIG